MNNNELLLEISRLADIISENMPDSYTIIVDKDSGLFELVKKIDDGQNNE